VNILIIDDSKSILLLITKWLEERHYHIKTASSGFQGLKLFSQSPFDLVILDVEMPKMNGFEVARTIRKIEGHWTPVVFMSTVGKESYYQKGIDAGGDFYFTKPLNKIIFNAFITGIERMFKMRTKLKNMNTELTALRDNTLDGILSFDKDGNIFNINHSGAEILSRSVKDLVGTNINDWLKISDGREMCQMAQSVDLTVVGKGHAVEYLYEHNDGEYQIVEMSITPYQQGDVTLYTGIMRNITERKQLEQKLKYLAQYDTLTGLPNRELFLDRLDQSLKRSKRIAGSVALLFIDLDRFKTINDTLGHDVGDILLTAVAKRLQKSVRSCDTVARLAGDEFVVIIDDFLDASNMVRVSEKIVSSFENPFHINGHELFVTTSVGIAVSSKNCTDSQTLIKHADMAMYKAKEKGCNQLHFYTDELNAINLYRMDLSNALNRAIEKNELRIHYQPQLKVTDNQVVGAEALLRWSNPKVGEVSPAEFIPLLEETGLIISVTEWMFDQVIDQWEQWIKSGVISPNAKLSVNLSAKHFVSESLINQLVSKLKHSDLTPENIVVEVTETVMMSNTTTSRRVFDKLTRAGIKIALDDFGTGYSSLSYLSQFPISFLKIDQSFIEKADRSLQDRALILAIINMANSLDLEVIAEGVDSKRKLKFLANNDCDLYQGFLFSKALSVRDFERCVSNHRPRIQAGNAL
jgi:diguanylate cyclase (GGDEF)-like protein/PAS domain S-box-containing protein